MLLAHRTRLLAAVSAVVLLLYGGAVAVAMADAEARNAIAAEAQRTEVALDRLLLDTKELRGAALRYTPRLLRSPDLLHLAETVGGEEGNG